MAVISCACVASGPGQNKANIGRLRSGTDFLVGLIQHRRQGKIRFKNALAMEWREVDLSPVDLRILPQDVLDKRPFVNERTRGRTGQQRICMKILVPRAEFSRGDDGDCG